MENFLFKTDTPPALGDFDFRYKNALEFFKKRSPVIFISQNYRFWEKHGFVQQSLAKELVNAGILVEWYDGAHWRKQSHVKNWDSPLLKVSQLPCLPLRRFSKIDQLTPFLQASFLKARLKKAERPFVWIQSGLDERVVEHLPYVDVFSVFDDPYIHSPAGNLAKVSTVIITQNQYAQDVFKKEQGRKVQCLFPPVEMNSDCFKEQADYQFPKGFPEKRMGYVGSFFSDGFDLVLFESFIKQFQDCGFVLCGRTDSLGLKKIQAWQKYKNFYYIPWVLRSQVGAVWKKIDLNLMLYRPASTTDGAFPVKFLEALYFGVPSVTTAVPKTSSLEGVIPRLMFPEQFKTEVPKIIKTPKHSMNELYKQFSREMCPKMHLIQVAEMCKSYE